MPDAGQVLGLFELHGVPFLEYSPFRGRFLVGIIGAYLTSGQGAWRRKR
jgi:hypothetical protein